MFYYVCANGGKRKHVDGESTSNQIEEVCEDQREKDTNKGSDEGRWVPRSRPQTLVSRSRIDLKGRIGS